MKNHILILMLLTFLMSCKEEKKVREEVLDSQTEVKELAKELEVVIEFEINKPSEISLMMDNIIVNEFQTKNIHLIEKVDFTTQPDKIVGKFGPNNISNKMTFSLGNKEEKEIKILSMKFSYGENTLFVSPKNLNKYLGFSKFSVLDTVTNKIKTVRIGNAHYPKLYVRKKLWDDLKVKF